MFSPSSRALLLASIGLVLTGCSASPDFQAAFTSPKTSQPPSVELLGNGDSGDMALYRKEANVKVGDSWAHAATVFPEPARGAYEIHDLPYIFSDKFEAHGWETARGEGFGVILNDNKIVGAIYELEHSHDDSIEDFEKEEMSGMNPLHPKLISSGPLKYWLWTSKDQITMMCAFSTKDGINFTMAMGDKNVMKALGVSEEEIKKQITEVQRLEAQPSTLSALK